MQKIVSQRGPDTGRHHLGYSGDSIGPFGTQAGRHVLPRPLVTRERTGAACQIGHAPLINDTVPGPLRNLVHSAAFPPPHRAAGWDSVMATTWSESPGPAMLRAEVRERERLQARNLVCAFLIGLILGVGGTLCVTLLIR